LSVAPHWPGGRFERQQGPAQFEAADQLIRRFVELGVPTSLHDDVQTLAASIPELAWASLRPKLLLTDLKVLDYYSRSRT
jgi:hypothetical protein